MLRIRLTRISNDRHRFEAIRADGSVEIRELETRSYLTHDLVHFAVESEGKLGEGFYGLLARGGGYEATAEMWAGDTGRIEKVVAMLQTALKGDVERARICEAIARCVSPDQRTGACLADSRPDRSGRPAFSQPAGTMARDAVWRGDGAHVFAARVSGHSQAASKRPTC